MEHAPKRGLVGARTQIWIALAIALGTTSLASAQDEGVRPEDAPAEIMAPPQADPPPPQPASLPAQETACGDRVDDDGDGLVDCADADCFSAESCHAGGREERTNAACGDWIDNDGDGMVDCDDSECQVEGLTACRGSWTGGGGDSSAPDPAVDELPELGEGQTIEDLIGQGTDANGERTDEVCSDGIDNDNDGRSDCADFGCRFDPQVTVCHGTPGMRFSVVAGIGATMNWAYDQSGATEQIVDRPQAGFTLLQLRALGPIPFIENSFFLISVRAEDSIRLTFLTFQIPISPNGHYLALNSGFGSLSTGLIVSAARQPLLDPPRYLYSVFEQGNGGALEVGGPIDDGGILRFRAFAAAGSGLSTGNVGGVRIDDTAATGNFTWTAGAQMQVNAVGYYDRFDTPFLYTAVPATLAFVAGAKYDQRATERFVAYNAFSVFQMWHVSLRAETFGRFILDDPQTLPFQTAWNVTAGVLLVPRLLFMAADVGGLNMVEPWSAAADPTGERRRQLDEFQWRVALHWYFFRSTGILAVLYREHYQTEDPRARFYEVERDVRIEARFRF